MFRKKVITREDGTPYLERTYYIKTKLFQIVKHKILQSDADCLHDHPWNFCSIILKGGYYEGTEAWQVLQGSELKYFKEKYGENSLYYKWYGVGSILFRKAEWKHKLRLDKFSPSTYPASSEIDVINIPCTTLVIMFNRRREWGFWTKNGWLSWLNYKSTQSCD